MARAISLLPFAGDITFNAKSGEKERTSLYGTEVHATRYQYAFALTPERLRVRQRALDALDAIANIGEVAGNHSRFLFDFSPESIVLRITDDPAPRILYCYQQNGDRVGAPTLAARIKAGDIAPDELYVGGDLAADEALQSLLPDRCFAGVKQAMARCREALAARLAA